MSCGIDNISEFPLLWHVDKKLRNSENIFPTSWKKVADLKNFSSTNLIWLTISSLPTRLGTVCLFFVYKTIHLYSQILQLVYAFAAELTITSAEIPMLFDNGFTICIAKLNRDTKSQYSFYVTLSTDYKSLDDSCSFTLFVHFLHPS